jgi:hypothetical protein
MGYLWAKLLEVKIHDSMGISKHKIECIVQAQQ